MGICKNGCGWVIKVVYLFYVPHALYVTSISACMVVDVFYQVIISDTTKEFLPGDDKELLN